MCDKKNEKKGLSFEAKLEILDKESKIRGRALFFDRYVLHGFPKLGSRERVFREKLGDLGAKIQKFFVLRAKILFIMLIGIEKYILTIYR